MSSDCLVLQINNNSSDDLNVNVFIIYDINSKLFVICGKRNGGVEFNYKSYSVKSTETFLYFIFSNKRYLNYSISNHSELPASHEEITYDYLNESLFENVYDAIATVKRSKKWKRDWKLNLIEEKNSEWDDLYDEII